MRPPRRAFTLVELMVAVTLIGILMGLATVGLRDAGESGQVRAAADQLAAQVRSACVHALTSRRPVALDCTANGCGLRKLVYQEGAWHWHAGATADLGVALADVQVGGVSAGTGPSQWTILIQPDDWSRTYSFYLTFPGGRRVVAKVAPIGGKTELQWIASGAG